MTDIRTTGRSWLRAVGIGIAVAVATAIVMLALTFAGASPFPEPRSLAFAEKLPHRPLPLPVGSLFHTAYVTFWPAIFVRYFPCRDIKTTLALAGVLWLAILVVFFPVVGWGLGGLNVSPRLIPASFVPHLLFGLLLWGLDKYVPRSALRTSHPA